MKEICLDKMAEMLELSETWSEREKRYKTFIKHGGMRKLTKEEIKDLYNNKRTTLYLLTNR